MPELVAATGSDLFGGFTLFQVGSSGLSFPLINQVILSVISPFAPSGNCMLSGVHVGCGLFPYGNQSKLMACLMIELSTRIKPRTTLLSLAPMPIHLQDLHVSVKFSAQCL